MAVPEHSRAATSPGTRTRTRTPSDTETDRGPPPPIPPSPTLTNPDMILPCDDGERESSTPSPPLKLPSLSHLQASYGMRLPNGSDGSGAGAGVPGQPYSRVQKNFPRHTWLHEGLDASRRLSDIGEEEVPSPRLGGFPGGLSPGQIKGIGHTAAAWSSSGSPVNGPSGRDVKKVQNGYAASRDGGGVNPPGVNQGREAIARGEGDGARSNTDKNMAPVAEEGGPGEEFSSAILSSEAERILDNAKKRLTVR